MLHQIKKAARQTSKNTIYSADGDVPINYEGWKARLTRIDLNWRLKQAEGTIPTNRPPAQTQKTTTPNKGGQTTAPVASTKTATVDNIRRERRANGYRRRQSSSRNGKVFMDVAK